jgi:hypothetical protein
MVGYGILILEVLTMVTWLIATYGNGMVLMSVENSVSNSNGFVNGTEGPTLTIPVTGAGIFPVTANAEVMLINNQNQTLADLQGNVVVSPGETKDITITIPASDVLASGSPLSSYDFRISFKISSLSDLVGMGFGTQVNVGALSGGGAGS